MEPLVTFWRRVALKVEATERVCRVGQLENGACTEGASREGCAVQIAVVVHDHPGMRFTPLVPLNEASVVIVPLPWANSKTVPAVLADLESASIFRCAVQIAVAVHDQAA